MFYWCKHDNNMWCEIGEDSFVGAGSVVTKNITKSTMWYGNPAIEIKKLDK